ncbi:MAG: type II toxin-antitoxin system ParD family antitoxin [Cyanobacteria bacterium J06628_3]
MNISFTPELKQFIQSQVASGKYASTEEVIVVGIKLVEEREYLYQGRFKELQQEIMIGVEASERGEVIDGETVFHQLEQQIKQRRQQTGK